MSRSPEHTARLRLLATLPAVVAYTPTPKEVTPRDKQSGRARAARAVALQQAERLTRR